MTTTGTQQPGRVLVIDDNEAVQSDFRKVLSAAQGSSSFSASKAALFGDASSTADPAPQFEVDAASQGEEGVKKVQAAIGAGHPYQVAFVDMRMPPGWDGLTTIRHLWEADPSVQVVICTAFSDVSLQDIAKNFRHTHQLLILKKPFDPAEVQQLAAALSAKHAAHVAAELQVSQLEALVERRTEEIQQAMLHDRLTGLPNRTLFSTRLEACIARRKRHPELRFAVLFLDFDRFKLVNDSLGHEVGDALLVQIADRLRSSLRTCDLVGKPNSAARFGGDEFVVLLEDLAQERDAARVARRLLDALTLPFEVDGHTLYLGCSIGVATSDREYERPADIIRDADTAMYRAKAEGRGRYVMFDRAMHAEVLDRLSLEVGLREAVREDAVDLHYQPIVQVGAGITGFEALARWNRPDHGMVPAARLIGVAEETGLIHTLSWNLLRRACAQLADWRQKFPQFVDLTMNVNLSRRLLIDPELASRVRAACAGTGVLPSHLVLEVTEGAVLDNESDAVRVLRELRQMGVQLYLDDFGTGYSSLSCLHQLPLTGLKVDRAFLSELTVKPAQRALLEAIVQIARAFGLRVVAEGVEAQEQLELVSALGIELIQGYLLGAPCDTQSAVAFLEGDAGARAP